MKKVLIIGASGSLARLVIDELEQVKDLHLTLFLRNKNKLLTPTHGTIIEGDVMDYPKLKEAVKGQDIVYINLSGSLEAMARKIVRAMEESGVKRVIAISSIGIYNTPLQSILRPYRKLADIIEGSGLDYTILRPDWFTNVNEVDYAITKKGEPEIGSAISRKSIASFISNIVKQPDLYKNENLGISKPN
jgi:uncharacterized protein YbjT (DUF2867 family)